MKNSRLPSLEEIELLCSYLPRLYAEGFNPIERWDGGEKLKDGYYSMPYPAYDPLVEEFFNHVSSDGWVDYRYDPEQSYAILKNEDAVKRASLEQIRSMLTFCVRGERFSDGHWGQMIEKGYIRRLLERLNILRTERLK